MTRLGPVLLPALLAAAAAAVAAASQSAAPSAVPTLQRLQTMTARFAPVPLGADLTALPAGEQKVVERLVEAARLMDTLFVRQVWAGNAALLTRLSRDTTPLGKARLRYFLINKGPWSRLDDDAPFVPGVGPKPEGANFYPADATKEQVEAWMQGLPEAEKKAAQGF
ncbi:MAG TPA: hypothetical protein VFO85_16670, partial [Vicinamibacteria bacterium]|nr:hypothetical protein [Vicinamibacteria bacterium]